MKSAASGATATNAPKQIKDESDTFFRTNLVPLALMLTSPPAVLFVWVICEHHDGSVLSAIKTSPNDLYSQFPSMSTTAAIYVISFLIMQLVLLVLVPGPTFTAIPTPMGNLPKYSINGVPSFIITHVLLGVAYKYGLIRYGALYDHFGPVLAFLNYTALVGTVLLYLRGIYTPTNSDSGPSGFGSIWDLWHGTELHPEIFGVSLKQLINCRFAMMGWSVAVISFAMKQYEDIGHVSNSMMVSTFLQTVYIFKFFLWEGGYFNSVRLFISPSFPRVSITDHSNTYCLFIHVRFVSNWHSLILSLIDLDFIFIGDVLHSFPVYIH